MLDAYPHNMRNRINNSLQLRTNSRDELKILLYVNSHDRMLNNTLTGIIKSSAPGEAIALALRFSQLKKHVCQLPREIDLAVLLAKDKQQLNELLSLKSFLDGTPLILILPDLDKESVSEATRLYPQLITSIDSDFYPMREILGKMVQLKKAKCLQ